MVSGVFVGMSLLPQVLPVGVNSPQVLNAENFQIAQFHGSFFRQYRTIHG